MENQTNKRNDWLLRFIKGMFIGSGFILPGVSGGALAAIFGIYERMIQFLANVTKNFKENIRFFLPVGLGAIVGIVLLSFGVSFLLGNYETIILWFFVGCIVGTVPSLWRDAGKEGRTPREWLIFITSFIGGCAFIYWVNGAIGGAVEQNFVTWMIAGGLISLGTIVPGLSPSNFIVLMGMYQAMADGFKTLNLSVIIPIAIGMVITLALFSKIVHYIFKRAYPQLFHFIFGIVMASTVMIIPLEYSHVTTLGYIACAALFCLGIGLGQWMSKLEDTYK